MIINLTQHSATPEQIAQGVVEPAPEDKEVLARVMTFDALPDLSTIRTRAETLAQYAAGRGARSAMIGGAPFLMPALERALRAHGVRPLYAFSVRESVEQQMADGTVKKTSVFRHVGFVGLEAPEVHPC